MNDVDEPNADLPPLRIALLIDAIHPGARLSHQPPALAEALGVLGHEVLLLPITAGILSGGSARREVSDPSQVLGRRELSPLGDPNEAAMEAAADQVLSTNLIGLLRSKPDVICAYDPSSPAAWIGARAAGQLNRPLVLIEPGWLSMRRLRDRVLEGFGRRVWGRVVRARAARLLAVDPVAAKEAQEKGFPADRIGLLPSGVDSQLYAPGLPSRLVTERRLIGRILLAVGPFESGRGLELLIQAFASGIGQREDWCLVLVGRGSLQRRLRTLSTRLGVGARVHLLEYPEPAELAGLMSASTMLAVPAENDTVRGKQVMRAMASGLPVIASDRPRLACQIVDGETGLLVPSGSLEDWRAALQRLAGAPELRRRLSRSGRECALERSWLNCAERLATITRSVVAEHEGNPRDSALVAPAAVPPDSPEAAEELERALPVDSGTDLESTPGHEATG